MTFNSIIKRKQHGRVYEIVLFFRASQKWRNMSICIHPSKIWARITQILVLIVEKTVVRKTARHLKLFGRTYEKL